MCVCMCVYVCVSMLVSIVYCLEEVEIENLKAHAKDEILGFTCCRVALFVQLPRIPEGNWQLVSAF